MNNFNIKIMLEVSMEFYIKKNKLHIFLIKNNIDIALISETRLKSVVELHLPNYITHHSGNIPKPGLPAKCH